MTRLVVFLMVLEIFNNEYVNSTIKYELEYKFEYKLEGFKTWKLVSDIIDYKLEFMTHKFKNLDEIQHTEIFAVVNFGLVKLQNFYDNVTSFFLTQFNLKLVIQIFQWFAVKISKIRLLLGCKMNGHFFRS